MAKICLLKAVSLLPLCIVMFCFTSPALAKKNKAEIVDVRLDHSKRNLEISFRIQNCFTTEMEEAILSGVETTFRILLVLEKDGFLFFKSQLLDLALNHSIRYDRLKNEFRVQLPENPQRIFTTADFLEAKALMSSVNDLPLIPLWRLEKQTEYKLRIKAELSKVRLPLFFRYIFYFVTLWDFETPWREILFSY